MRLRLAGKIQEIKYGRLRREKFDLHYWIAQEHARIWTAIFDEISAVKLLLKLLLYIRLGNYERSISERLAVSMGGSSS